MQGNPLAFFRRPDARRLAITEVFDLTAGLLFGGVLGAGLTVLLFHGRRWFRSRWRHVLPVPSIDMPPLEDILRAEFHCGSVLPVLGPLPELVKLEKVTISPEISDFDRLQLWDSVSIHIDTQPTQEDPGSSSVSTSCETLPILRPKSPKSVSEKEELQEPTNCSEVNLFSTPASALPTLPAQSHKVFHAVASTSPCFTLPDLRISGPKDPLHKLLPVVLPQNRYDPRPLSPLGLRRLEAPLWPQSCLRLEVSALQTRWEPGLLEPASNPILPMPRPATRKWHGPITSTMKGPWWSKSTASRNMRWVSRSSHPGPGFYDAELTNIFGRIPGTFPGFPNQSRLTRSKSDGP